MKICFSGHRPPKLGGYDYYSPKNVAIRDFFYSYLRQVISECEDDVIELMNGAALGFDTMMGDISIVLREEFKGIKKIVVITASPTKEQGSNWFNKADKDRLHSLYGQSDKVVFTDEALGIEHQPIGAKLFKRNLYMADHSDTCIVLHDGTSGGTANFLDYARKQNKDIRVFSPQQVYERAMN